MTDDFTVSPQDLDYQLCYRAHSNTSHCPEDRARSEQNAYAEHVRAVYSCTADFAETDEQQVVLLSEMERYRTGYKAKVVAHLQAMSRCYSVLITGADNFNNRRHDKANAAEHKRLTELLEWDKRARAALLRAVKGARTAEQVADSEWTSLRKHIDKDMATVWGIDNEHTSWNRPAFVNSVTGKLERLASNGKAALVNQALDYIRAVQSANTGERLWKKPFITERKLATFATAVAEKKEQAQTADNGILLQRDGIEVSTNPRIDRVQIFFPGKPDATTIGKLKSNGWHWSPREGAWQRQLTENAKYNALHVIFKEG